MNIRFELREHSILPTKQVIEVHHGGAFIATITGGDDNPEIRIVTKHPVQYYENTTTPGAGMYVLAIDPSQLKEP